MCHERREDELDGRSWWDYMRADVMSQRYRSVIVDGLTQNFVAMDAKNASTKSVINILARLLNDFMRPDGTMDRVLNGPTSEVWINHWESYLKGDRPGQIPVEFKRGHGDRIGGAVQSLNFDETRSRIDGIILPDGSLVEGEADYFVAAVPIEAMIKILKNSPPAIQVHAPSLANLRSDVLNTNWMSSIMFYLKEDVTMDVGHVVYLDSKWALTSISENQYWKKKVKEYGNKARGVLSVIISDWFAISPRIRKAAQQTDNDDELVEETLAQIQDHLRGSTLTNVDWHNIHGFYVTDTLVRKPHGAEANILGLMPAREFASRSEKVLSDLFDQKPAKEEFPRIALEEEDRNKLGQQEKDWLDARLIDWEGLKDARLKEAIEKNLEPLFINTINSWQSRPNAWTEIDNLFLASDYVKTSTDLATMEGANEAARRAVNALLDHMEEPQIDKINEVGDILKQRRIQRRCSIFAFDEPAVFAPFRRFDKMMYDRGLPHAFSRPKIAGSVRKRLQEWWDIG
jgi:hypothetical protein